MLRLASRLLGASADAEDVVQEAWARAFEKLSGFRRQSTLATWLCGITVNVVREVGHSQKSWEHLAEAASSLDVEAHIVGRLDLERAVSSLSLGARTAFLLHDVEGFTHDEIALQTGWHPGTSKTLLFRARRSLRRMLSVPCSKNGGNDERT
jgi:RNA polymerase sigma-70 factor (ECF subfamily)